MITTIQIHQSVKQDLQSLKHSMNETYEDVIVRMIKKSRKERATMEKDLKEGYLEMETESASISKEWESADMDWD